MAARTMANATCRDCGDSVELVPEEVRLAYPDIYCKDCRPRPPDGTEVF